MDDESDRPPRFAAKKAGLYPRDDDEEALRIDEVCFSKAFISHTHHLSFSSLVGRGNRCTPHVLT